MNDSVSELERILEDIITQKWVGEWCTTFERTWNSLRWCYAGQLRCMFFPKSVLRESYILYKKNEWAKDTFEFNSNVLSEEDDLISVYNLTFDREASMTKKFFCIRFEDAFCSFVRTSCSNSRQLGQEFSKLNRVYFVQRASIGLFLKRSCPLLFSYLTEYRLRNNL